jgi:sarcosine oxidase
VHLTRLAYDAWREAERESGETCLHITGGIDLFPAGAVIDIESYRQAMHAIGIPFEDLTASEATARWPAWHIPADTEVLYQANTGIVSPATTVPLLQRLAADRGARLRGNAQVMEIEPDGDQVNIRLDDGDIVVAANVVIAADAWTSALVEPLGATLPLVVTKEQVTYYDTQHSIDFDRTVFPVWIWMDDPSFYGFPTYPEGGHGALVKAAQDCGGAPTTASGRSFDTDPAALALLSGFVGDLLPGVGPPAHTVTCLYTLTPDRDFVIDAVPGHPSVYVGLGAAHAFKFAPTFGRVLADLATGGSTTSDIGAFAMDRPALVDAAFPPGWLV